MAADEPQLVRGIDWRSTFPFTLIFRSFRIAIHPSKLVLALLALVLIYLGGNLLDNIWPASASAVQNELNLYEQTQFDTHADRKRNFLEEREQERAAVRADYDAKLAQIGKKDGLFRDIKGSILADRDRQVKAAWDAYNSAPKATPSEAASAQKLRDDQILSAYTDAADASEHYSTVSGRGLFAAFSQYQIGKANAVVNYARHGQWLGSEGVLDSLFDFFTIGPSWALRYHYIFFTILTIYFLIIWAIFGGAISRIAAVQVARDEKISFRQVLGFSSAKFLSFVSAPIIPLLIVVVVGLVLSVVALLINIPFIGPIAAGLVFILVLAAGFVMTLVLIGLLGGFNLMYPTIAVEGSDSFDAISRSFSYLYARPWRLAFYTIVAAAYGTVTYVFVRLFLRLMLSITHYFVGLGVFVHADNTKPLWSMLWPDPLTAPRLAYGVEWISLSTGQSLGALLLGFWIYLAVAMLGAYAISFYFSTNTIIYVLMRHEVDATELDDVYLEQTDEEFMETPPAPPTAPPPTEQPAPAPVEGPTSGT